jgi:hypothetical protein
MIYLLFIKIYYLYFILMNFEKLFVEGVGEEEVDQWI